MNFQRDLQDRNQVLALYGTTPPKATASAADIEFAAERLAERIASMSVDGIVVYDVQDESARNSEPRPFPFLPTLETRTYSQLLAEKTGRPILNYKSLGHQTAESWAEWLAETETTFGLGIISLVGSASSREGRGAEAISLTQATEQAAKAGFTVGAVAIAERHSAERSESANMLRKQLAGCSFFVSQAIYCPETTIHLLQSYQADCEQQGVLPRRIFLTFTPSGNAKTLDFIEWLGVAMPAETKRAILESEDPLAKSIEICEDSLRQILEAEGIGAIPLGLNIESVSIRKVELDASIDLAARLSEQLGRHLEEKVDTCGVSA